MQRLVRLVAVAFLFDEFRPVEADISEQHGSGRDLVQPQKVLQQVVEIPRRAGDIENGIHGRPDAPVLERLV